MQAWVVLIKTHQQVFQDASEIEQKLTPVLKKTKKLSVTKQS